MEIHATLDQCNNASSEPPNNSIIMNSNVIEEAKDFLELSPQPSASLCPITPDSDKETATATATPDIISNLTSPLTTFSSPPRLSDSHSHHIDAMRTCTPKEGVFDPFAPGPDKLMLAPHCTKYLQEARSYVVRRLNFRSSPNVDGDTKCDSDDTVSDEDALLETVYVSDEDALLETVYDNLLKAIISRQSEEIFFENSSSCPPSPDGLKTPTSAPLLNGIAETCPGAPRKPERKLMNIDLGLCRKLEF